METKMFFGNHEGKRPETGEGRMPLKKGSYENNEWACHWDSSGCSVRGWSTFGLP